MVTIMAYVDLSYATFIDTNSTKIAMVAYKCTFSFYGMLNQNLLVIFFWKSLNMLVAEPLL